MTEQGLWSTALGAFGIAAATLMAWWLWLGRDTEYQTDPVTGVSSGPYEVGQVAGCVITLCVVTVIGALFVRPLLVVFVITLTFTAAWSWTPAQTDETGLWGVGAMLVFVGLGFGSSLLAFGTWGIRRQCSDDGVSVG